MNCPTCDSENDPEARFCTSCGVPLQSRRTDQVSYCTGCGSENIEAAQFCIRCGLPMGIASEPTADPRPPTPEFPMSGAGARPSGARAIPPRDLAELLSETFRVLRASFWTFFLIALVAQSPTLIAIIAWPAVAGESVPLAIALVVLLVVASWVLSIIAAGAILYAVILHYLGLQAKVSTCYAWAANRFWSLLVAAILYPLVVILLFVTVIGIPLAFYLTASWYFYMPVILLEGRGPVQALDRSRRLVRGTWWRVFGVGIVFTILSFFLLGAVGIPAELASLVGSTVGNIAAVIGGAIVMPILPIAAILLYIDLRVRKEGYTLEALAQEVGV